MAFQRADPRPFTLHGFQALQVQHCVMMVRVVAHRPQATHEDYGIVTIHSLPDNALQFAAVREVVEEFLEEHMNIRIHDIQRTHLGKALVRFAQVHDRDLLVNHSPHPYGGIEFTIVRHNQGRNWRSLNFNCDCWLMLMGFPLDFWNQESIQCAIASFGRVMIWKNGRSNLARLFVRARVTELQDVPHYIVYTDMEGFQGQPWTIQCEILEQNLLGVEAADEEQVPVANAMGQPPPYDFFWIRTDGTAPSDQQQQQWH
jgi:hypothetical protein